MRGVTSRRARRAPSAAAAEGGATGRASPDAGIVVGDELVGFDEYSTVEQGNTNHYRQLRTAVVEAVSQVVKPSVVVHAADGSQTLCSEDHLWLIRRARYFGWYFGWRRADELQPDS